MSGSPAFAQCAQCSGGGLTGAGHWLSSTHHVAVHSNDAQGFIVGSRVCGVCYQSPAVAGAWVDWALGAYTAVNSGISTSRRFTTVCYSSAVAPCVPVMFWQCASCPHSVAAVCHGAKPRHHVWVTHISAREELTAAHSHATVLMYHH